MSATTASCDHIHDWFAGTKPGEWVSMAVASDGSYGIPAGIIYSFPVTVENGEWKIVQGLAIDDFSRGKMDATLKKLEGERDEALSACLLSTPGLFTFPAMSDLSKLKKKNSEERKQKSRRESLLVARPTFSVICKW